jgi:hypothetical protein
MLKSFHPLRVGCLSRDHMRRVAALQLRNSTCKVRDFRRRMRDWVREARHHFKRFTNTYRLKLIRQIGIYVKADMFALISS